MDIYNYISLIIERIKKEDPQKIILFGSYVNGTPSSESDIDILIVKNLEKEAIRDFRIKLKLLLWDIVTSQNIPVDILVDNEERINQRIKDGDLFYKEIIEKGRVIYA